MRVSEICLDPADLRRVLLECDDSESDKQSNAELQYKPKWEKIYVKISENSSARKALLVGKQGQRGSTRRGGAGSRVKGGETAAL